MKSTTCIFRVLVAGSIRAGEVGSYRLVVQAIDTAEDGTRSLHLAGLTLQPDQCDHHKSIVLKITGTSPDTRGAMSDGSAGHDGVILRAGYSPWVVLNRGETSRVKQEVAERLADSEANFPAGHNGGTAQKLCSLLTGNSKVV